MKIRNFLDKEKQKKTIKNILLYIVLIIFGTLNIYPLIWMIMTSFKTNKEISAGTFAMPTSFNFQNYINAWKTAKMGTYFYNSIIITLISIILTIIVGTMASYIIARFKFKLNNFVYVIFVFGMLIPIHTVLVPLFIQIRSLNLYNTRSALIFPYIAFGLPTTIYILTSFIKAFPNEIEESAIIDGCSIPVLFVKIILPMCRPAIATVTILNFLNNWNEFAFALVLISKDKFKTLPIGLVNFVGAYTRDYSQMMSALTIAVIPTIIIYLLLQEYIIKGMTQGAIKE